jgi:hypothetical protein
MLVDIIYNTTIDNLTLNYRTTIDENGNTIYAKGNIKFTIDGTSYSLNPNILSYLVNLTSDVQQQIENRALKNDTILTGNIQIGSSTTNDTITFIGDINHIPNSTRLLPRANFNQLYSQNSTVYGDLTLGLEIFEESFIDSGGSIIFKINGITYTLTRQILSYLVNLTSDVHTQINNINTTLSNCLKNTTSNIISIYDDTNSGSRKGFIINGDITQTSTFSDIVNGYTPKTVLFKTYIYENFEKTDDVCYIQLITNQNQLKIYV